MDNRDRSGRESKTIVESNSGKGERGCHSTGDRYTFGLESATLKKKKKKKSLPFSPSLPPSLTPLIPTGRKREAKHPLRHRLCPSGWSLGVDRGRIGPASRRRTPSGCRWNREGLHDHSGDGGGGGGFRRNFRCAGDSGVDLDDDPDDDDDSDDDSDDDFGAALDDDDSGGADDDLDIDSDTGDFFGKVGAVEGPAAGPS